jgi:hypothetical protein
MKILTLLMLIMTGSPHPIELKVSPTVGFAPLTVHTTITVERNYLNTDLCLAWGSEYGESGQHCWHTEGQYIPVTTEFAIKSLSPGVYAFQASVAQGPRVLRSTPMRVEVVSGQ